MWYNPLVTWLLRSPLHRLMDGNTVLLTYTGHKSGRRYSLPISYVQDGERWQLITRRQKPWWRNVAAGTTVTLWLRGEQRGGWASVTPTDPTARLAAILSVYRGIPHQIAEGQVADAIVVTIELEPVAALTTPAAAASS